MTRKPKSIYCHYHDSLHVNSNTLKSFLNNYSVPLSESEGIINSISSIYNKKVETIVSDCNNNWTNLESFYSPLVLFIDCIDKVVKENELILSKKSQKILQSFTMSMESWMMW